MKKILFVTGTRADYGKLKPLAKTAQELGHHASAEDTLIISRFLRDKWGKRSDRDIEFGDSASIEKFRKILKTSELFDGKSQKFYYEFWNAK